MDQVNMISRTRPSSICNQRETTTVTNRQSSYTFHIWLYTKLYTVHLFSYLFIFVVVVFYSCTSSQRVHLLLTRNKQLRWPESLFMFDHVLCILSITYKKKKITKNSQELINITLSNLPADTLIQNMSNKKSSSTSVLVFVIIFFLSIQQIHLNSWKREHLAHVVKSLLHNKLCGLIIFVCERRKLRATTVMRMIWKFRS